MSGPYLELLDRKLIEFHHCIFDYSDELPPEQFKNASMKFLNETFLQCENVIGVVFRPQQHHEEIM